MPQRSYLIYPDSCIFSVLADPRRKDKECDECAALLRLAEESCTIIYSETTLQECGPDNTEHKKLATYRLRLLDGKHKKKINPNVFEIARHAFSLLELVPDVRKRGDASFVRDARHLAAAALGGASLLVTYNMKDLGPDSPLYKNSVKAKLIPATLQVVSPQEAMTKASENPRRPLVVSAMTRKLYARQQYWSMRDEGYDDISSRRFVSKKWSVRLLKRDVVPVKV